jgi:hypothetical protein
LVCGKQCGAPKREAKACLKSGEEGLHVCPKELGLTRKLAMEIFSSNTSGHILIKANMGSRGGAFDPKHV